MAGDSATSSFITDVAAARAVPKALLHDHLDGGLRPTTIIELAEECGWVTRLPSTDPDELQAWFTAGAEAGDILKYLETFEHTVAVLQTAESLERVAAEAVVDLAADGVVYAEIRFAPELHAALPLRAAIDAVCVGVRRGECEAAASGSTPIAAFLICCAMRTEHRALEVAQVIADCDDPKVVGFDLAGAETGYPPSMHARALAFARQCHLNITLHASEPPDLELIDDAIVHGAHRIGHGVRLDRDTNLAALRESRDRMSGGAIGDLRLGPLARHVLDRQIHLEMAPTCNVQIGAVATLAEHPVGPFLRAGFNVGINTDNRLMSEVSPASELLAVGHAFELTSTEVERLVVNAIESGFAPYETRRHIIDTVVAPSFASTG